MPSRDEIAEDSAALRIARVTKRFGGLTALDSVSLDVKENSITGLIGPNGSGKTTLFNLVTGLENLDAGEIYLKGVRIDGLRVHERTRLGISRSFQIVRLFPRLTVLQHMKVSVLSKGDDNWQERALQLLDLCELSRLKSENAGNLSFGQQKLLEFVMAVMPNPELVMLDEPVAGVNPVLIGKLSNFVKRIRDQSENTAFLVIEHNLPFIVSLCDYVFVLDHGVKIAEGPPKDVQRDPKVLEAYIGGKWER